jgi:hypothetical protein
MTTASLRLAMLAAATAILAHANARPLARPASRSAQPSTPATAMQDPRFAPLFAQARARGLSQDGLLLVVAVDTQTLTVVHAGGIKGRFPVSTAVAGVGSRQDSNRTPLGWHRIDERIGGDEPPGRVFVSRAAQARRLTPDEWRNPDSGDYVLTRILWLRGLEPGVNVGPGVDSHDRHIYLHGTNQEHLLGQPSSHGCIRLSNRDVMELFDWVADREAWCLLVPSLAGAAAAR